MSIETLLEAARFLEWQAQQQQITRDESEYTEKMLLNRGAEQRCAEVAAQVPPVRVNHVTWEEGSRLARHPAMVPPPLVLPPVPITVIPIPMASGQTSALPITSGSAPRLSPAEKDSNSPLPQQRPLLAQVKMEPISPLDSVDTTQQQQQQLQLQPTSIVATAQHTLLPGPTLLQSPPGPIPRLGPVLDDPRHADMRRRPGGAGTREVHNKLEKNRRAHLKECFETLKRNIPNVDEKKTSNLSVLRSAIRYIQTLKRKEKEYEHEMERLAREKISTQQRLTELKNELSQWVDVLEIERVLRQTVQPEDDQASTSTASEGEDNVEQDLLLPHSSLPKIPPQPQPEVRPPALAPQLLPSHVSIQHRPKPGAPPHTLAPLQSHLVAQPTVISHASVSHASVIQAVSHVIQAGPKHIGHIAPSATSATTGGASQPIGHITVHPVAHLGHPLPGLYPQTVAVTQPATVVGHLAHTLTHGQVNGVGLCQPAATALVGKQASVGTQVVTHHPQLVGQAVLNPVTMVTMPSFPVSTLKLA